MSAPRPEIKEIVNRFQKALQAQGINPERVILYGSYAKDTAREGSDIDLIVISRDFAKTASNNGMPASAPPLRK
jgi:predicted nucleotidyltransferase